MDGNFDHDEKPRRFERSFEVSELIKTLSALKQGDTIDYDVLSSIVMGNCSPGEQKYPYVLNARRALLNEHRMVFRAIPNKGLQRLDDVQIVERSERKVASATSSAKKEMRILTFVDFDKLSDTQQLTHNTNMSVFNVMKTVGQFDKIKKIRSAIANVGNRLEIEETIKAFSGKAEMK